MRHALQHLGCSDDPLSQQTAFGDELLLDLGKFLEGDLDSQVASRHHDTAAGFTDLIDILHAVAVLDLGDELDPGAAFFTDEIPYIQQILLSRHEGAGDEIHSLFDAEGDVRLVLFAEIDLIQDLSRKSHGLAVGDDPSELDGGEYIFSLKTVHIEYQKAVVHKNLVTHFKVFRQIGIGDTDSLAVPDPFLSSVETEVISCGKRHLSFLKCPDPVLGSFGIKKNGDGKMQFLSHPLDLVDIFLVLFMCAVGEVQSGDVHSRQAHLLQNFLRRTCGADRANDFCFSHVRGSSVIFVSSAS